MFVAFLGGCSWTGCTARPGSVGRRSAAVQRSVEVSDEVVRAL